MGTISLCSKKGDDGGRGWALCLKWLWKVVSSQTCWAAWMMESREQPPKAKRQMGFWVGIGRVRAWQESSPLSRDACVSSVSCSFYVLLHVCVQEGYQWRKVVQFRPTMQWSIWRQTLSCTVLYSHLHLISHHNNAAYIALYILQSTLIFSISFEPVRYTL
jgi:hypothetical protein